MSKKSKINLRDKFKETLDEFNIIIVINRGAFNFYTKSRRWHKLDLTLHLNKK